MLILAGVSINAIVGDNGVLTRTQYASFLNEMAAVEEAVQLWKAGETIEANGEESKAIPANGLCKANELMDTERLVGEVGYYRTWSIGENAPAIDILSDASTFNSAFESELIFYPAGVQDLYYLNNETLGIKENKEYLIDAATGMIYSMTGIGLKGVRCYSSNMAKAVMNGDSTMPLFAESEVSGTGSGEKLAGNVTSKYLYDENGNLILNENGTPKENPEYNPNGFNIISSTNSNNVYKLYNNGDLYAKGIKGTQLNSSMSDMEAIKSNKWIEITVPPEIGNYKKIVSGQNCIYVIDDNDDLWAWGNNSDNKFGLTQEQLVEYTGREPVKINLYGKKVDRVFDCNRSCIVITQDNKMYACGSNDRYALGGFDNSQINEFKEIVIKNPTTGEIKSPNTIKYIIRNVENDITLIAYNDEEFYISGRLAPNLTGYGSLGIQSYYKDFCPIWNGYRYKENGNGEYIIDTSVLYDENLNIASKIKKVVTSDVCDMLILMKDNTLFGVGTQHYYSREDGFEPGKIQQYSTDFSTDVKDIFDIGCGYIILRNNGEVWGLSLHCAIGLDTAYQYTKKIDLSLYGLDINNVKEIYTSVDVVYYLMKNGDLYGSATNPDFLGKEGSTTEIVKISNAPKFASLLDVPNVEKNNYSVWSNGSFIFLGEDGKKYSIGSSTIWFRNDILQKSWIKIAQDVKKLSLGNSESIAYLNFNNEMFIAGNDSRMLGLGTENQQKITNFMKYDNSLLKDNKGKSIIKDVKFSTNVMYILTTTGYLYATGMSTTNGVTNVIAENAAGPGWENYKENHYDLQHILPNVNVKYIATGGTSKVVIGKENNENVIYGFGKNYNNSIYSNRTAAYIPIKLELRDNLDISKIFNVCLQEYVTFLIAEDEFHYNKGRKGDSSSLSLAMDDTEWGFRKSTKNYFNGSNLIDVQMCSNNSFIFLTNQGTLYGCGNMSTIGINSTSISWTPSITKVLDNISQVTAGNGFYIAVTKDGKVYGTGSNQYGILGRWVGIDRNTPNSRYKTAFEWVECPELEI